MDKVFAALDSDVRRQILVYLSTQQLTFNEIKSRFPYSSPAILYHLRMLQEAGFILRNGSGRACRYRLMEDAVVRALGDFLATVRTPSGQTMETIEAPAVNAGPLPSAGF